MKNIFIPRREFIKNTAVFTASSLILPSLSFGCESQETKKLGVALVGLGNYSTTVLSKALTEAKKCYLAGVVTGTPAKAEQWSKQYNIPKKNLYNYSNFSNIADNKDIDIVYVVLPNSMHGEYTMKALEAGKHVICEKPMAMHAQEAMQMIEAAKKANRKLAVGYRMHYDPNFMRPNAWDKARRSGRLTTSKLPLDIRLHPRSDPGS